VPSLIDPKFPQRFPSKDDAGIAALRLRTVVAAMTNILCNSKDVSSCGKSLATLAKQLTSSNAIRELGESLVDQAHDLLDVVEPPALTFQLDVHARVEGVKSLL
jgi:hypothetical protein